MMRTLRAIATLLLALVLEMSVTEFLSVQDLSDRRRRERFALPHTCKPAITAARAVRGRVHVLVTCLDPEADENRRDHP
jgi:hypothetical protein